MDLHALYGYNADYVDKYRNDDFENRIGYTRLIWSTRYFHADTNPDAICKALLQTSESLTAQCKRA